MNLVVFSITVTYTNTQADQCNTLLLDFADNSSAVFCKTSMFLSSSIANTYTNILQTVKQHRQYMRVPCDMPCCIIANVYN